MKNEIKVGDWIRDREGHITKIIQTLSLFKDVELYLGEDGYQYSDNAIVKHSTNLIDILECGDYINGHKIVNEIWGEDDNNLYFEIEGGYNKARYIGENEIKKVVTKEQFEAIGYKVTKM